MSRRSNGMLQSPEWIPEGVHADAIILTSEGLKPIKELMDTDLVWDGEEFVRHDGLLFLGRSRIMYYEGLIATRGTYIYTIRRPEPMYFLAARLRNAPLIKGFDAQVPALPKPKPDIFVLVYTILNCGPRHRYGCQGWLVHNTVT